MAYADFVTAMMALFIVLWLLSSSEQVKKAVGGYFQDPTGKGRQTGSTNAGIGETLTLNKDNLQQIKEKLDMLMRQMPRYCRLWCRCLRFPAWRNSSGLPRAAGAPASRRLG